MAVGGKSAGRPASGETLLGATVSLLPGGKGLNQAVAAARLGVPTAMLGAVGGDAFGATLRTFLANEDVNSIGVSVVERQTTGVAVIQLVKGDNALTAAGGANDHFTKAMISAMPRRDEVWRAQFETPVVTTQAVLAAARDAGAHTVLNLAPMVPHP